MSLTAGRRPFDEDPGGRLEFTPDPRTGLVWEPVPHRLRAFLGREAVFDTTAAKLLYETGHRPVYYVPEEDLRHDLLEPSGRTSRCPHKGEATYRTIRVGTRVAEDAVWAYRRPIEAAAFLAGRAGLYWDRLDEWFVDDRRVFSRPRDPYHVVDVSPTPPDGGGRDL